jgi:hypothetical protein
MGIGAVVMGVIGYITFLGIIVLVANVKNNECSCSRDYYGHCKC